MLEVVEEDEGVFELIDEVLEVVEDAETVDEELEDDGVLELALELPRDKKDDDVAEGHPLDDEQAVDVVDGHGVDVLEGVLHIVVLEIE